MITRKALPQDRLQSYWSVAVLLVLSGFFIWLHWSRLPSCWGDNARWLYEAQRWADGEVPYVDFIWQYPPLGLWLAGIGIKLGGPAVMGVQTIFAAVNALTVVLALSIARRFLPERLALGVALTLLVLGAVVIGPDTLFSMKLYTPAVPTGVVGLLWLLLHAIDIDRSKALPPRTLALYTAASTVCLLAKPEFMIAWAVVTVALALTGSAPRGQGDSRRIGRLSLRWALLGLSGVPALLVYLWLAHKVGLTNLKDGILGYGVPKLVCPWWPTGLGIFGAAVATLQASAIRILIRWGLRRKEARSTRSLIQLGVTTLATLAYVYVLFRATDKALTPRTFIGYLVNFNTWALVAQWGSMAAMVVMIRNRWTGGQGDDGLLMLTIGVCSVAIRGFFGSPFEFYPTVHFSAHSVSVLTWSILIVREAQNAAASRPPPADSSRMLAVIAASIFVVRIVLFWLVEPSYYALPAEFGGLRVAEHGAECADIHRWLTSHPKESMADIAYGGVIEIVTGRRTHTLSTQYQMLNPSSRYQQLDLQRFRAENPDLVIAERGPHLNTWFGIQLKTRCEFPRIVWKTRNLACDSPEQEYPIVTEVKTFYRPVFQTEHYQILRRTEPARR